MGFAGINPAWGRGAIDEAERCAQAGLKGVGELHPDTQSFDLGDEMTMRPLIELALDKGMMLTTHASEPVGHQYQGKGTTRPEVLWRFIECVNNAAAASTWKGKENFAVVMAHWGGGLPFYALMPEVNDALTNVYFDTAASPFLYQPLVFDAVAQLVGAHKILLASDYPLLGIGRLLKQLNESSLSAEDREAVSHNNAAKLLGLV